MSLERKIFVYESEPKLPSYNLAVNESIMKSMMKGDYDSVARVYRHKAGVILGHLESREDVNQEYCLKNDIEIVHRETGGSAVIVDPNLTLCYSVFVPMGNIPDVTYWYRKLSFALLEKLKEKVKTMDIRGAYYVRVEKEGEFVPFIGHAARRKGNEDKFLQFDGIVHTQGLLKHPLLESLRLRQLYSYGGEKFLKMGKEYYTLKGTAVNGLGKQIEKEGVLVKDELKELQKVPGLAEVGISKEEFIQMLFNAFNTSIGPLVKKGCNNFFSHHEKEKKQVHGSRFGLGHCFVDLVEPEEAI